MAARGLLGRLGTGQRKTATLPGIVAHLEALLNAHQGHSYTVPRYGVLDFNDVLHNLPDAVRHLQQEIRATIIEHEPRLQNVNVRFQPSDDLVLQFEILARLKSDKRNLIRLRTRVRPGGRFVVE